MKKILIITLLFPFFLEIFGQTVSLIPRPATMEIFPGSFTLSVATKINAKGEEAQKTASSFNAYLKNNHGFELKKGSGKNSISLEIDKKSVREAYTLTVENDIIKITGDPAGLFYGIRSLQQLIPVHSSDIITIPCLRIEDKPRFSYRGMILDVGRYFYPLDDLKKFIDLMAHYKMNVFHWHLTEDGGWRIEIKKYPELTRKGAWRSSTQCGHGGHLQSRIPHGGFYTQDEVKELVAYAAERHVTIIPEIEMPGHSMAVLAVYPELSCVGGPFAVPIQWRINQDIFCAGNDAVFSFLEDVLSEIIPLFPSKYIHIGGDEAPKKRWEQCPKCQARIQAERLEDERELQSYFIRRIEKFINSKGKRIIGWDEILEGGLAPNATVMNWREEESGIEAAVQGHDVIMALHAYTYLDYSESTDKENEPISFPRYLPLSKTYNYEPYAQQLTSEQYKHIIGIQGSIWTAFIHSEELLYYMAYPRVLALSETAWSPASEKNYADFLERLPARLAALDKAGITFRIPEPAGWDNIKVENGMAIIELRPLVEGAKIYYTTDGSDPAISGELYSEIFRIPLTFEGLNIKCIVSLPSGRNSSVYTLSSAK